MYSKTTVIKNPTGLHARPASEFVNAAGKFASKISICRTAEEDEEINVKSIVLLLTLGLCQGEEVKISAKGEDEKEAVDKLVEIIEGGFGEI